MEFLPFRLECYLLIKWIARKKKKKKTREGGRKRIGGMEGERERDL